eukprot:403331247
MKSVCILLIAMALNISEASGQCTSGEWYNSGTCDNCPAGYQCTSTSATPTQCSAGYYSPQGTTTCLSCTAGSYCPTTASSAQISCASGFYSSSSNAVQCTPCPSGSQCTSTTVTACSSGYYSLGQATSCTQCPAGYQCSQKYNDPVLCPSGFYSLAGSTTCTICPAGSYCASSGVSPIACDSGQFSVAGSTSCTDCPAGFSCSTASALPVICPEGYYSNTKALTCTSCPAGYYCPDKSSSASMTQCADGFYSIGGQSACIECPAGKDCTNKAISPVSCSTGYYSVAGSTVGCTQCPAGFACTSQKEVPNECPSGYYSNAGDAACSRCTAGSYCPTTSSIVACSTTGASCLAGSTAQTTCPTKYGCASASVQPIICATGYYPDPTSKQCVTCPAGYQCSDSQTSVLVTIGYYSPSTTIQRYVCPAGYSCLDTATGLYSVKVACTSGQYADEGDGVCTDCPIGYACPSKESSLKKVDCTALAGFYSDATKLTQCNICPPGYKCPAGTQDKVACTAGTYAVQGSQDCKVCPPGFKCPSTLTEEMTPCTLGTYSPGGLAACLVCQAGYQCSNIEQTLCPTYQTSELGHGYCSYFIAETNAVTISSNVVAYLECDSGQFKLFGTLGCLDCPIGHYCPQKHGVPVKCPAGTYQDLEKQISCKSCSSWDTVNPTWAYYSIFGEIKCHLCPAGHFCPTVKSVPKQCQLGFYSEKGSTSCTACDDGHICRFKEQVKDPQYSLCPVGFYCKADLANGGKLIQMPCDAGYYQPFQGKTSSSDCIQCPLGTYCPRGSETPRDCTPGSYCVAGTVSNQAYMCTGGTFSTVYMGQTSAVCQTCPKGYYCPIGANYPVKCPTGYYCEAGQQSGRANPCLSGTYSGIFSLYDISQCQTCPVGFYCPTASTLPKPCPKGTYNELTSRTSLAACLNCPAQRPCPYYGQSTYENGLYCAHGNYCPAGTNFPNQYPCPAGKYSDSITITSSSSCLTCPEKFACYEGTNTLTRQKVPCASGHYCPAGTVKPDQYPCPSGTYSPYTDNYDASQCILCPAGYYCDAGSSTPTGLCVPGYYCPQGSSVSNAVACLAGTYQPFDGARSKGECQICPLGSYCTATSTAPIPCPAGTYGPLASLETALNSATVPGCYPCESGYKCPTTGLIDQVVCGIGYYSAASQTDCTICPLDYFCSNITTTQVEMLASKCDYGFKCPVGTSVKPFIPDYACPKGKYCQNSIEYECPTGTYNPVLGASNSTYCLTTPAGYYNDLTSSTDYHDNICPQGYYCPAGTTNKYAKQCPAGSYRNLVGATQSSDCGLCPTGHYCPTETVETFVCPLGYYCPDGSTYASPCPIGTFGASVGLREESDCTSCYAGRYCSQVGLSLPDGLCDAGYYCITGAFTATPTDGVTGDICTAGGYCLQGSKKPANCPPGTYNPNSGGDDVSDCIACLAGYYCVGSNVPTPTGKCFAGYYCLAGSMFPNQYVAPVGTFTKEGASAATDCVAGKYNPFLAQSECLDCPEGFMCPVAKTSTLTDCPTGSYCLKNTITPTLCGPGYYNSLTNAKSPDDCQACTSGKFCATSGLTSSSGSGDCAAGFFCQSGAISATPSTDPSGNNKYGPCPKGYYCPLSTGAPFPCPSGTFGASTGLTQSSSCTSCTAGKYCNSGGLSAPQGDCSPGYYCPVGTISMRPLLTYCTLGEYCPLGSSSATSCPAGTYQNQEKQASCITCPKGYYCPLMTSTFIGKECPMGYYCPAGTQSQNQYPCPQGTYNIKTKASSAKECVLCDPGRYCGTGTALTANTDDCPAGQFCFLGAIKSGASNVTNAFQSTYSGVCPQAYYCPLGSAFAIPCPAGHQCNLVGGTSATKCPPGYYCQEFTINNITQCPIGSYCPEGISDPINCPAGTYLNSVLQDDVTDCTSCPATYSCPSIGMTSYSTACPAGYYCPGGQKTGKEFICQKGYRCPASSAAMIACNGIDEYQDDLGQSVCKKCPAGFECTDSEVKRCKPQLDLYRSYYCTGSIRTRQYCPAGTFNNIDRSSTIDDCEPCPPGYYCPNDAALKKILTCPEGYYCIQGSAAGVTCPIGFYCPSGSNTPIPCSAGMYCGTTGLISPSGKCTAGYYCTYESVSPTTVSATQGSAACADYESLLCKRGSTIATQNSCPMGSYCPEGSSVPTACPIGTYSNKTNIVAESDCTPCDAGKFCRHRGATAPSSNCAAGYYCPSGQETDQPENYECEAGYYCPEGYDEPVPCAIGTYQPNKRSATCLTCPDNYICESTQMTEPVLCPQGYYCSQSSVTKQPCPIGTYSEFEGLNLISECQRCKNGMYCDGEALIEPTDYCDAGFYCKIIGSSPIIEAQPLDYICPKGSYCPQNSTIPIQCPPGTYNDQEQQSSEDDCEPCPKGYVCDSYGISDISFMKRCPLGYYCESGVKDLSTIQIAIFLCEPGYFCDSTISGDPDDWRQQCPLGTYNPMIGQSACFPCPTGRLCDEFKLEYPKPCPKGSYCPAGDLTSGISNEMKCPAGTTNAYYNITTVEQCQICPKGQYCLEGETKAEGTNPCDAGYLCDQGATSQTDASKMCPTGHYCPAGAKYPSPCIPGTYNEFTGLASVDQCLACPNATYTSNYGSSICNYCSDGFVCFQGSNNSKPTDGDIGRLCDKGHYCKAGVEYLCPKYTYQNLEGQTSCFACPKGYNCDFAGIIKEPVICEATYFCRYGYQERCLPGTYANNAMRGLEGPDQCIPCPTGYYCQNGTLDTQKQACDPGFFCLSGAKNPNDTENLCPAGFYCDSYPTLMPIKCPNGTFSLAGAKNLSECTECTAGYYCMDGSSQKYDCPEGSYCPKGTGNPVPCPKGSFNGRLNGQSISDCQACPSGALCNMTGISNPQDFLCPPGYYCVRGALEAVACKEGTYRSVKGGSSESSCTQCDSGFYCNNEAQVVPIVCPNGTFCPTGSLSPTGCPPGQYCPAKSATPTKCPAGFYCPGRSELYYKCQNGTYCPAGSSAPVVCPGGTFGSGNSNNVNQTVSCDTCGRGQYSLKSQLGLCLDCTPGYVCLGSTNSATPQTIELNNGYECPPGNYCPLGSYKEQSCPAGTYNKYEGRISLGDCLGCKAGYYNDQKGQAGCKKCGPSSKSLESSQTCSCIGKNRRFVKSIGACLCETGYKPKDGKADSDSVNDCEAKSKSTCADGQEIDIEGNCVASTEAVCKTQCQSGNGTLIEGTGVCTCSSIVDPDQVCNTTCRAKQVKMVMQGSGNLTIYDPISNKTSNIDPTNLKGYIGDFKCLETNTSQCQVYTLGASSTSNDFTYDYSTDQALINSAGIRRVGRMRQLQTSSQTTDIKNPVMCIKQGNSVLFQINSYSKQYPVYYKDSILNTNKDFDYGQFLELQNTIERGTVVNAFSYIFKDAGIYVFKQSTDASKFTIIGVVSSDQSCSNADANVQAATAASLASIGIVSQKKVVNPNWSFIIGVFAFILLFSFGIVTLIILLHNRNSAQNSKSSQSNQKKNNIYYDRIEDLESQERNKHKWYYCLCKRWQEFNRGAKVLPNEDVDISYQDLEKLLAEFKESMDVLKQKMKEDGDKQDREGNEGDQNDEESKKLNEEDLLIQELNDLRKFVYDNKECIEDFFGIHRDQKNKGKHTEQDDDENQDDELNNSRDKDFDHKNGMGNDEIGNLLRDQQNQEEHILGRMQDGINALKDHLINDIRDKNDEEINRLLDEFRSKISSSAAGLSEQEKQDLMNEMQLRLGKVEDIMLSEETSQDKKLQDALSKRRKKKEQLAEVMIQLNVAKQEDTKHFSENMDKIAEKEQEEIDKLEKEIDKEKQLGLKDIEQQLKSSRNERLADMEKKLEQMRKLREGSSKNGGVEFGDMLNEYGKLVKKVEEELENSKQKQMNELDDKLKRRKQDRLKAIQASKKEREEKFHQDQSSKNKTLTDNIDQIKSLLKPVINEDQRIQALLDSSPDILKPVVRPGEDGDNDMQILNQNRQKQQILAPYHKQMELVAEEEDQKIQRLMDDMQKQADKLAQENERQKQALQNKIDSCTDPMERKRLVEQFDKLQKQIEVVQNSQIDQQNEKLRDALRQRKLRKDKINDKVKEVTQDLVLNEVQDRNKQMIALNTNANGDKKEVTLSDIEKMTQALGQKFEKDELIQVAENFLEQKHLRELQEYMVALFEERARGLRKYIFSLMTQKQTELELIREEFNPQYDFLRDRKAKGLITESQYKEMMAKLHDEENERRIDCEIQLKELEQKMEEELMIQAVNNKNEAEQAFKDRQSDEKLKMIDYLISKNQGNDAIRQYLEKEKKNTLKELVDFKNQKEKEKQLKLRDIELMRENRENELREKEERMLNWEERMKQEEAKHQEAFEKQKNAILTKKLNEQKSELLREVNKDEIDRLVQQHKRDLANLETALQREQQRQLENMRSNMGERLKVQETDKVKREIKMAQLIKDKDIRSKEMLNMSLSTTRGRGSQPTSVRNDDAIATLIDRVHMMQKPIDKKMYCGKGAKIYVKNYQTKKVELLKKLLKKDDVSQIIQSALDSASKLGAANINPSAIDAQSILQRVQSQISDDSLMEDSVSSYALQNLTFKELIEHVDRIEVNYQQIKKKIRE